MVPVLGVVNIAAVPAAVVNIAAAPVAVADIPAAAVAAVWAFSHRS